MEKCLPLLSTDVLCVAKASSSANKAQLDDLHAQNNTLRAQIDELNHKVSLDVAPIAIRSDWRLARAWGEVAARGRVAPKGFRRQGEL